MWKDSETEIDYLDFSYIVEIMKDTINDEKLLPSCIGLYGDWGSGKSSLMHMCKRQLEQQDDGTVCLLFNGWLYESYDDAKTAIIASILDGIKENRKLSDTALLILKGLYDSVDKFKAIKRWNKIWHRYGSYRWSGCYYEFDNKRSCKESSKSW